MFGIGGQELLVVFLVVLLLFGAERIPEFARALGRAIGEFKRAAHDLESELRNAAGGDDGAEHSSPKGLPGRTGRPVASTKASEARSRPESDAPGG